MNARKRNSNWSGSWLTLFLCESNSDFCYRPTGRKKKAATKLGKWVVSRKKKKDATQELSSCFASLVEKPLLPFWE